MSRSYWLERLTVSFALMITMMIMPLKGLRRYLGEYEGEDPIDIVLSCLQCIGM